MTYPSLKKADIEAYRKRDEIIRLTTRQVIKDFAMFGMDISFSGNANTAYDELFSQLSETINRLLETDYSRLISLLYHIDISENELNKELVRQQEVAYSGLITGMILDRELKKVIIREYLKT